MKQISRWDVQTMDERTSSEGRWVLFTDHEQVVGELQAALASSRAEVEENEKVINVWRGRAQRAEAEAKGLSQSLTDCLECEEDYLREISELRTEVEGLLEVIAPFAHFALVRSALGSTAPKGGTVYSACTTLGDAEISAEDFEAAFNAIARNTNAAMEKGNV